MRRLEPLPAFLARYPVRADALRELAARGAPIPAFTIRRWTSGQSAPDTGWLSALRLVGIEAGPEALRRSKTTQKRARRRQGRHEGSE